MNTIFIRIGLCCRALAGLAILVCMPAFGVPGAHGPGGEHLDAAAANAAAAGSQPRIEARSELFELVGYLRAEELSVMINRFETNEPVLNASVEVSMGASKAGAKFHADHGDYAVEDAAFLKALSAPGDHALIFTVVAGGDSDLLEGTLKVTAAQVEAHGHSHALEYAAIAAALVALLAVVAFLWRARARRRLGYSGGALS